MAGNPSIDVELGLIVNEFDNGVEKVTNKLKDLAGVMTRIGTVLSATVTAPILALGVASIKTFGNLEALQKGLIAAMGSAEAASGEFTKLIQVAKLPGLGLQEAARGSVALQAAGFSADQAREALLAFGNALATVGKGKNELNFVILALTQLQNKTSGFGQDLRQLTEQLPQLRGALTEAFGTADSEKIAELGVTGKEVVELITKEFAKLPAVTGGINNAFENLSDSTAISLARIGESINKAFDVEAILGKLGSMLDSVSTGFSKLDESTQVMIIAIAGLAAAIGPLLLAVGGIISLLPTLTAGLVAISGPFGLIAIAVAAAIPLLFKLNSELQRTKNIAGLVKADLLAESLKESRLEFERLSKALEGTGLTALEAQNRAIDLLLKQELDLLKARKDNKDIDFEAIKARVTALNALKESINKVSKSTLDSVQTFEEFSKIADEFNRKFFLDGKAAADEYNKSLAESADRLVRIDELSKQIVDAESKGIIDIDMGIDYDPSEKISEQNQKVIDEMIRFRDTMAQLSADVSRTLETAIVNSLVNFGVALGQALAEGSNFAQSAGKALLSGLATILGQLGELAIATGIAILGIQIALKSLNPYAAIAAGIALVALSQVVGSKLGGLGSAVSGGSGGGLGAGSGGTFTGSGANSFDPFKTFKIEVVGEISGENIGFALARSEERGN